VKTRTLVYIKPDCVGNLKMFVKLLNLIWLNGFNVVYNERIQQPESFWREFYAEHSTRSDFPDFDDFVRWLTSMPLPFIIIEGFGDRTVGVVREEIIDVLRKEYETSKRMNAIHGSSSAEDAKREIALLGL
jgi:nucleoside-diphosphate kinase